MDTKISEIISILPGDLQSLLLQHKEFMVLLEQAIANYENIIKMSISKNTLHFLQN